MPAQDIINVTESNFEYEVINYSHNIPVVVDFWAEWCVPCKMLDPILRKLASERGGEFRLAKVNVDENQNLAMRYNIRGIPAVKAFREGNLVKEFSGIQQESKVRKFLEEVIPTAQNLKLEKGNSLLEAEKWADAQEVFQEILENNPGNSQALLGLTKVLLAQGRGAKARDILNGFPFSKEYQTAENLLPLAIALSQFDKEETSEDSTELTYNHALRLIQIGNLPAAMDGILDVMRVDKNYRDGQAKALLLALFEILGPNNPMTRQYQAELATVLFS
jgi:putative thioredoxin